MSLKQVKCCLDSADLQHRLAEGLLVNSYDCFGDSFALVDSLACLERIQPVDLPGIGASCWIPTGLVGSLAQVSRGPMLMGSTPQGRARQRCVLTSPCQGNHVVKAWKGDGFRLQLDGLSVERSRWLDQQGPLLPLGLRSRDLALPLRALNPGRARDLLPRLDG